jgi:hypothetical protein
MERTDYPQDTPSAAPLGDAGGFFPGDDRSAGFAKQPGRTDIWTRLKEAAHHPNGLTLFRVAVIPLIIVLFSFPNRFLALVSALVFSAAAVTDYLDGFMARRQGKVTFIGKVMDPVADKLLNSSAFIMLAAHGWVPAWIRHRRVRLAPGKTQDRFPGGGHHPPHDPLSVPGSRSAGHRAGAAVSGPGLHGMVGGGLFHQVQKIGLTRLFC